MKGKNFLSFCDNDESEIWPSVTGCASSCYIVVFEMSRSRLIGLELEAWRVIIFCVKTFRPVEHGFCTAGLFKNPDRVIRQ
jgi:hypothetical protein